MIDTKLFKNIQDRYAIVEKELQSEKVMGDNALLQKISVEYTQLKEQLGAIDTFLSLERAQKEIEETIAQSDEQELVLLAQEELEAIIAKREKSERELELLLLPKNPDDLKDVVVEMRAGAGGDEAALFAAELFRAYARYVETKGWNIEIISQSTNGIGGMKEMIFEIHGAGAHGAFKYESGVHRVQRIPETEKSGRVHTSTITVAVMPVVEEIDIHIPDNDLRIDVFRSSGPGGQSVNTTDSAVRVTHIPTGLIVTSQDGKSQHKNREKALTVMRSRLYQMKVEEEQKKQGDMRRSQIGTGDRSEKIRTYNFPQDRITDHRIKQNWNNITGRMEGDLDAMIHALQTAEQEKQLSALSKNSA